MDIKIGNLHVTDDYSKFEFIVGNRSLDKNHVAEFEKAIKRHWHRNGNSDSPKNPCFVIEVDEKHRIINGQHRFKASQNLKAFIGYYHVEYKGLENVQERNRVQRGWTLLNWLDSHVNRGICGYYRLSEFAKMAKEKGIRLTSLLHIVSGGKRHQASLKLFKTGAFRVDDDSYVTAEEHVKKLYQLKSYLGFYANEKFVAAVLPYFNSDEFDFDYFVQALQQVAGDFRFPQIRCSNSVRENQQQIEMLYNTARKFGKKKPINFGILPEARQLIW